MACLDMYNSTGGGSPMSPRISFSNDFVEIKPEKNTRKPLAKTEGPIRTPSSSDFEFSVTNYSMMTADELFFKGKLLPFKETTHVQRTLREELLVEEEDPADDDNDNNFTLKPPLPSSSSSSSSKGRWKGLLGLKRAHVGSKRADKINEERFVYQESALVNNKPSQEVFGEEGSNCRDVEDGR